MIEFSLGGIGFNDDVPDAFGAVWYGRVEGWDELSNRVEELERPTRHGGIVGSNLYAPRRMTVFGAAAPAVSCSDSSVYYTAKNNLLTLTNALTRFALPAVLLIGAEEVDKQMRVLRTLVLSRCIDGVAMEFEMTLVAEDPFKYATAVSTLSTSGNAVNTGTAPTFPTFTLTSSGAPTLTLGSATVTANASLPSGTVIDFGQMTVLNGSTDYFGNMNPASEFFALAPGGNTVASTVAGTWSWRSAWL